MLREAADAFAENAERAMTMAYKASMELRAAEDRITQLPAPRPGAAVDVEAQILKAIEHKQNKGGAAYSGKMLVVFLNAGG